MYREQWLTAIETISAKISTGQGLSVLSAARRVVSVLYSVFYIILCILYSTLYFILYSVFYTLLCILYSTLYFILFIFYSVFYTLLCIINIY